jgi:2-dehydropantoate 2-reductase
MRRVALIGVGGVGGVIGACLGTAGTCELTLVSRGAGLARLKAHGLEVTRHDGETIRCSPRVVSVEEASSALGPQDYVLIATKAYQLSSAASLIPSMCDAETRIVPLQNGLPFWFFHEFGGRMAGSVISAVDPAGVIHRTLRPEAVIGCMSFVAGEVEGDYTRWLSKWPASKSTLTFGEIGQQGPRRNSVAGLAALFGGETKLPLGISISDDVRRPVLEKLMVNASVNPLATLARADCAQLCDSPGLRQALRAVCREVEEIASGLGIEVTSTADDILARYSGQHGLKASMLQDLEAGRLLERSAILDALVELGGKLGVKTPTMDTLAALLETLEATQLRPGSPQANV